MRQECFERPRADLPTSLNLIDPRAHLQTLESAREAATARMVRDLSPEKMTTPPPSPTIREGEVFKSPASSISAESGVDLKFFPASLPQVSQVPKFSFSGSNELSVDSIFTETYLNSVNSTSKLDFDKTAWETIYAIREGRKLVKPTFQGTVYNFLERPKGWTAITYHCGILGAVLACLILSVLTTVVEYNETYAEILYYMEIVLVVFLSTEYVARLWSAGCRSKYLGLWGRFRFLTKPISIIDLIIIVASIFVIAFGSNGQVFATSAVRGVRFLQILRMLHMDRQGGSWRLLGSVVYMHRQELMTTLYIGFLGLVFSSYFMYIVEKDVIIQGKPSDFASYADALWWGVVTMMTIGYGDKVPHTWAGRVLACVSAMFTVSFFALPAGILGSGFALKVQQQQRQKHFSRQIPAAATLIQCLWRCYAADKKFNSSVTWEMYLRKHPTSSTNKYNKAIGALRLRRNKSKGDLGRMPFGDTTTNKHLRKSLGEVAVDLDVPRCGLHHSRSVPDLMIVMQEEPFYPQNKDGCARKLNGLFTAPGENMCDVISDESVSENQDFLRVTTLSETHKNAIRAIRKMKYYVAKRKFQQARKPYDVGDVIEQYSQGQLSMMVRIKELQRRLEHTFGKPGSHLSDKTGKPMTIGNKLQQMDQQMQRLEKKLDSLGFAIHTIARDLSNHQRAIEESHQERI